MKTFLIFLGTLSILAVVLFGSYLIGQSLYDFLIEIEADKRIAMTASSLLIFLLAVGGISFGIGKWYSWTETKYGGT